MQHVKTPFGLMIALLIIGFILSLTSIIHIVNIVFLLVLAAFLAVFIHQLGHVVGALLVGYQFQTFTAGPLTVEKSSRLILKLNMSWSAVKGKTSCSPKFREENKKHEMFYVACGPIFSLATGFITLCIGALFGVQLLTFYGLMSFIVLVVTIVPNKGDIKSDGRKLLELMIEQQKAA